VPVRPQCGGGALAIGRGASDEKSHPVTPAGKNRDRRAP
jgi:hypothetical protein